MLGEGGEEESAAAQSLAPRPPPRRKAGRKTVEEEQERESDQDREAFDERMHLTRDVEALLEGLYRDFLALRLSDVWDSTCVPMMRAWAAGQSDFDAEDTATHAPGSSPPAGAEGHRRAGRVSAAAVASSTMPPSVMAASPSSTPLLPQLVWARPSSRVLNTIERLSSEARMLYLLATDSVPIV